MRPALLHAIASILLAACSCRPPVPAGTPAGDSCLSEPAETALLQTTRIGGRPRADTGLQRNAPQPDQVAKSVAVVLRGKAFREGRQHNTAVAKDPAQQLFATQSQIVNLVLPLESAGFSVHVFSATYTCKHTHSLVEKWSGRLRADVRTATEGSSQSINAWDAVSAALDYASKHSLNFTIAAVLRHDMILKKNIGKMIVKKYEQGGHKFKKFLVPFKMIKKFRFWPDRVPDTIQIMSGDFLPKFQEMLQGGRVWPREAIWDWMCGRVGGREVMGFMEDFFADSDPAKAWNPIYAFAGRPEGALQPQALFGWARDAATPRAKASALESISSYWDAWPAALVLCVGMGAFRAGECMKPREPSGHALALVLSMVYVGFSVSIDIFIKYLNVSAGHHGQKSLFGFNRIVMVMVTECCKLVMSTVVLLTGKRSEGSTHMEVKALDVKWMALPAAICTLSNILVFTSIGANDTSVFGVFRDTMILWTAAVWKFVFRVPLGHGRTVAIAVICSGLFLNEWSQRMHGHFGWAFLWVLMMTFCNAAGSVSSEYAMKRNEALDINLQNILLYAMSLAFGAVLLAATDPRAYTSLDGFFRGFTAFTWTCAALQACAGLLVSRMLKYTDAVMKAAAVCLRGPVLLLAAPFFVPSLLNPLTAVSALVVTSGSLWYMLQGPISKPSQELK